MNPVRWIVGLALLPRALHVAGSILLVFGVLIWIAPATCAAIVAPPSSATVQDAGTLEQAIEHKTAQLAPVPSEYGPPPPPELAFFIADLKSICCPQYCQARNSVKYFDKADRIFEACAKSLCDGRNHPGHIVCDCKGR